MNLSKILKIAVISAAALGATVTIPWAFCDSAIETYAVFQCSDRAYAAPVPAPFTPQDVNGVFWQLGFGNAGANTGTGTDGSGVRSKSNFNGNDSGLFAVDILDAAAAFPAEGFPAGAICLGSNNWANAGIDGCCDNPRAGPAGFSYQSVNSYYGPYTYVSDDHILNPFFGTYFDAINYPGYYSLGSMQDYPTAVLLKTPGDSWFALAAVTNMDRNNTGFQVNGPCNYYPGTNAAACDIRQGFYTFAQVSNGLVNAIDGQNNVLPWQPAPRPIVACTANCSGAGTKDIAMQVGPVFFNHDQVAQLSNNPTLPNDATRAGGVGVVDLLQKWGGLVRYSIESAAVVLDPNGNVDFAGLLWGPEVGLTDLSHPLDANGDPTGPLVLNFQAPSDTCYRAVVDLGRAPLHPGDGNLTNAINCRDGGCGDVGYRIASSDASAVTCIGGALVSESIASSALDRSRGVFSIRWTTSAELSVDGFDIFAVNKRGAKMVESVNCDECTSGLPGTYSVNVTRGDLRGGGVEAFRITMRGGNGDSVDLPVNGRGMGRR